MTNASIVTVKLLVWILVNFFPPELYLQQETHYINTALVWGKNFMSAVYIDGASQYDNSVFCIDAL